MPKPALYSFSGKIIGAPEGKTVYLIDDLTQQILDSSTVSNQSFAFNGSLPADPCLVQFVLKGQEAAKKIWLTRGKITFEGEASGIAEGEVYGSLPQNQFLACITETANVLDETDRQARQKSYIYRHPDQVVSAHQLFSVALDWKKETVAELYHQLTAEVKASRYGRSIARIL